MDATQEGSGWCGGCEKENGSSYWDYSDYWSGLSSAFSHSELVAVTTLCVPLLVLGLMGNILTILVVWLRPQMRSTTYFYLSSMAMSDIMMLVLMPLDLYKLWWYRPWFLGDAVCKLSQFVSECCTFSSILHMTALGAERYVGVCFPLRARLLVTRGRVRVLIGALWGVAALSAGPVLVLVGAEPVDGNLTECRVTRWAESSGLMVAMLWLSNLYFIVPLTTLTLLYTLIARRLRQRRHVPRDHAHRQTLRMMVVIVCVFVVCWLPFHVARTLFCLSVNSSVQVYFLSQYLNLVSFVLFYCSAAVNPLLYNIMSSRYRDNVRALLRPRTRPLPAPSPSSTHF
ncbi:growth hormone secretagogue receptor type 1-like isoform X1 [Silurus meridionalis]|uniref:growth hormone secretagogue receptor type 1-like isoform X1 n=1 Tax=Silurus meridionalis TaxID=175797 RepID=UPI001EEAC40F|nr:growth hormone secretagogue receptor type 1-like isoform X1 [Silurus meridionalis]